MMEIIEVSPPKRIKLDNEDDDNNAQAIDPIPWECCNEIICTCIEKEYFDYDKYYNYSENEEAPALDKITEPDNKIPTIIDVRRAPTNSIYQPSEEKIESLFLENIRIKNVVAG